MLFDYYGAACSGAAAAYPTIRVYLFSDSIVAFVEERHSTFIPGFISRLVDEWFADGLLPQGFIGYGTFVEHRSNYGKPIPNFFGTEIHGTALVDAAKLHKKKPLGARIFVSETAWQQLPENQALTLMRDKNDHLELFLHEGYEIVQSEDGGHKEILRESKRRYIFNCGHHWRCIDSCKPGRIYDHYVWSIASSAFMIGRTEFERIIRGITPTYEETDIELVVNAVNEVLEGYKPANQR